LGWALAESKYLLKLSNGLQGLQKAFSEDIYVFKELNQYILTYWMDQYFLVLFGRINWISIRLILIFGQLNSEMEKNMFVIKNSIMCT